MNTKKNQAVAAHRSSAVSTWIVGMMMLVVLASCGSSKHAARTTKGSAASAWTNGTFSKSDYFAAVQQNASTETCLTAKVRVEILMDGKSTSTTGTLRMQRDEVVQLSVVDPILGIAELGRMEFSKDRVLIIDRFHKQYIDVPYADCDFLHRANVYFDVLQSLFWNEVFQAGANRTSASAFSFTNAKGEAADETDAIVNLTYNDGQLSYEFQTVQPSGTLSRTVISSDAAQSAEFQFDYSDFQKFGGKEFPFEQVMAFVMGNKQAKLRLNLSSVRNNSDWVKHTPAPKKYTKADANKILRSLFK